MCGRCFEIGRWVGPALWGRGLGAGLWGRFALGAGLWAGRGGALGSEGRGWAHKSLGRKLKSKLSPGWALGGQGGRLRVGTLPRLGVQLQLLSLASQGLVWPSPFTHWLETGWLSLPGSVRSQPRERKPFISYNNRSTWTGLGGGHTLQRGLRRRAGPPTDLTDLSEAQQGLGLPVGCTVVPLIHSGDVPRPSVDA